MIDLDPLFLFTFISRNFEQEQIQIRLNLVVALATAQLAFLSGIDALEPKGRVVLLECIVIDIKKCLL